MKAQECFREALSLDPHHVQRCCVLLVGGVPHTPTLPGACKAHLSPPVPSLLLCGIVAVMLQHCEEAEIFFEDACCLEPSNVVAWTLSGIKASQSVCSRCSCSADHCFCPCSSSPCSYLMAKGRILLRV